MLQTEQIQNRGDFQSRAENFATLATNSKLANSPKAKQSGTKKKKDRALYLLDNIVMVLVLTSGSFGQN